MATKTNKTATKSTSKTIASTPKAKTVATKKSGGKGSSGCKTK